MNTFVALFLVTILVLVNITLSRNGKKLYWFYEISHFLGGFLLAGLFINFFGGGMALLAVLVIGTLWEVHEVVVSKNKKIKSFLENKFKYHIIPPTFSDTGLDLFLDVLGASVYLFFIK